MRKKFVAVEDVLDIFDENRLWYYIPSLNGYEVSSDGYLRSMKHYVRFPYGIIIKPRNERQQDGSIRPSSDPLYELYNNDKRKITIRLSQIIYLVKGNTFIVQGYPKHTIVNYSDNKNFVRNKDGMYVKVYGNRKDDYEDIYCPVYDNSKFYPKFVVIQNGNETLGMSPKPNIDIRVPIQSIKGNEYYGRQDCRIIQNNIKINEESKFF